MSKKLEAKAVGKWQFLWNYGQDLRVHDMFARSLQVGVLKIVKVPEEGTRLRRRDYKGFLVAICFRLPIFIERNWP